MNGAFYVKSSYKREYVLSPMVICFPFRIGRSLASARSIILLFKLDNLGATKQRRIDKVLSVFCFIEKVLEWDY